MSSVHRVLLALLLLSNMNRRAVAVATDDGMSLPMGDNSVAATGALGTNLVWDVADEDEGPKLLLLADKRRRGSHFRGLHRRLPVMDEPRWSQNAAAERLERRDNENDIDMLRCMIGRVYRPCWGAS
ncbi:pro-MCH [Syngnathus scovelli]|uniref:pro-MCH n=1 Tax=Syngnathus scovelli TaxID=161590 RepID=UPI002110DF52|nr:pro-MCH [Syngnathus scovelli]